MILELNNKLKNNWIKMIQKNIIKKLLNILNKYIKDYHIQKVLNYIIVIYNLKMYYLIIKVIMLN